MARYRAIFLPLISIDDEGTIEAEWMNSYSCTQDMHSPTFEEVDDAIGEPMCDTLDERLELIRDMLATRTLERRETGKPTICFQELVRPFFVET